MSDSRVPRALFCFGRDELCKNVKRLAAHDSSVLLFGGRQCGKTTVLLKIAQDLGELRYDVSQLAEAEIPVYIDLMQLPHDAGPSDVFELFLKLGTEACHRQIIGLTDGDSPGKSVRATRLEDVIAGLASLNEHTGDVDVSFLFLLDEAKRILGGRFSRGFQDNLFALLYGNHEVASRCRIVFAGAQDLYQFADDDTSPIASRAARQLLLNLRHEHVLDVVKATHRELDLAEHERRAALIYEVTGGQTGLTTMLSRRLTTRSALSDEEFRSEVEHLQAERRNLFDVWREALSPEARAVHDLIIPASAPLDRATILRKLELQRLDPARWDWARDELQFTGIAWAEGDGLRVVNRMYADVARKGVASLPSGPVAELPLADLLASAESARIERKSSLRWDYHQNKKNEELELVVTQTLAAFQNTEGGCLLIGVNDNGKVLGLGPDFSTLTKKPDRDGFEQHLVNVVSRDLGKEAYTRLRVELHALESGDVCVVRVDPSPKPVYVRIKDKSGKPVTQFWIRTGNTKQELTTEEAIEYILTHWPNV